MFLWRWALAEIGGYAAVPNRRATAMLTPGPAPVRMPLIESGYVLA